MAAWSFLRAMKEMVPLPVSRDLQASVSTIFSEDWISPRTSENFKWLTREDGGNLFDERPRDWKGAGRIWKLWKWYLSRKARRRGPRTRRSWLIDDLRRWASACHSSENHLFHSYIAIDFSIYHLLCNLTWRYWISFTIPLWESLYHLSLKSLRNLTSLRYQAGQPAVLQTKTLTSPTRPSIFSDLWQFRDVSPEDHYCLTWIFDLHQRLFWAFLYARCCLSRSRVLCVEL